MENPTRPNEVPQNQSNATGTPPAEDNQQNTNFDQQPATEQPQPAMEQPQPIVPGYGAPQTDQPQPVVPPKKPMDPKTKKMIIIICSAVGGLLILGIAALIILPIILKVDYEQTYDLAESANDIRYDIQNSDSCGGVTSYVNSSYQTESTYEKYVSECKGDLAAFKESIEKLAGSSGVQRDDDIKKEWEEFKTSYDAAMPAYEKLIDVYSDWHTFVAGWSEATDDSDWWDSMSESKVQSLTSALTSSDIAAFKKYGEGFASARWKQISARQAYQTAYEAYYDASYSSPNKTALRNDMNAKYEVYRGAERDFQDYVKNVPDVKSMEDLVGVDLDKSDNQFLTKFGDVYSEISAKYMEQGFKDAIGL